MKKRLVYAGYYVDFSQQIVEDKKMDSTDPTTDSTTDPAANEISPFDSFLTSLDPEYHHITPEIIKLIKEKPCIVATKHINQGCSQEELLLWKSKKSTYAVLKGIKVHSTKKQLHHILGEISINGEKLHIVMYNDSSLAPFSIKMHALRSYFKPLPQTLKFKCMPFCQ